MNNEITVKIKCSIEDMKKILTSKNFIFVEEYLLNDIYYIPKNLKMKNMEIREILNNAIILRNIIGKIPKYNKVKLTIKKKQIDENGDILNQNKVDCEIFNINDGKKILEMLEYKEIMNIKEKDYSYKKGNLKIDIKEILNGENLIEIEENDEFDTLDKIKQILEKLNLPVNTNDYFVKKAEIELNKIL